MDMVDKEIAEMSDDIFVLFQWLREVFDWALIVSSFFVVTGGCIFLFGIVYVAVKKFRSRVTFPASITQRLMDEEVKDELEIGENLPFIYV